ncbi:LOW QUALITY PROTEIN: prostaglandin E2 receptor EP2 subtype [Dromiciops gliroides]|uniref:LOW QUALITY PROTEIN: prostaglandin E2 receptor EP2 subtype n=1 Tax=Dromiciops gliroides TaxID=33562 RepID=UPI001CC565A0|nr:LOW QUALITY PROTEIN: prostaglandin E2 receptor EP2 subtype [Dromiciops gliroides]
MNNISTSWDCKMRLWLPSGENPAVSAVMFSTGVLGNLLALALLIHRWWGGSQRSDQGSPCRLCRTPISLFHLLVTELVFTDLLGTCLISPVVLASYSRNQTLVTLASGGRMCTYFAFTMTFFSLATMLMLFAMALERCLSIGHPYYFYKRCITWRLGLVVLPGIYVFSLLFCSFPLLDNRLYAQYCPGTWCFIKPEKSPYLQIYATLLLLLIVAVLLCNVSVILNLARMHHRRKNNGKVAPLSRGKVNPGSLKKGERMSMSEEIDHLILLAIMTITFVICSLPFTIYAYLTEPSSREKKWELQALRFLSINSIIDPWIFVILRPPVLRLLRSILCCQISLKAHDVPPT